MRMLLAPAMATKIFLKAVSFAYSKFCEQLSTVILLLLVLISTMSIV